MASKQGISRDIQLKQIKNYLADGVSLSKAAKNIGISYTRARVLKNIIDGGRND